MARMTTVPEPKVLSEFKKRSRATEYPWEEWTDGKIRELVRGVHFKASGKTMRQTCSKHASKNGLRLVSQLYTENGKEILAVQFLPKGNAKAA